MDLTCQKRAAALEAVATFSPIVEAGAAELVVRRAAEEVGTLREIKQARVMPGEGTCFLLRCESLEQLEDLWEKLPRVAAEIAEEND